MAYIASLSSYADARDFSSYATLKALGAVRDLQEVATQNNHRDIVSLGMILELQELMANGMWQKVYETLGNTEEQLNIAGEIAVVEKNSVDHASPSQENGCHIRPTVDSNLKKVLIVHALVIGTLFYTYVGDNAKAQSRMKMLHEMLDCGALGAFGKSGIVTVGFPDSPSSFDIQVTHPRIVYALGFLVSCVAKRDPVGRKPKRRLFAQEGVLSIERELRKEVSCTLCCSIAVRNSTELNASSSCMGIRI